MINKLKTLKGKSKLKVFKNLSYHHDEKNIIRQSGTFHFEEDLFSKNVQGNEKNYHEKILILKLLQSKPQVKSMNIDYYKLFYTVIKNSDEKEIVDIQNENNFNNFIDFLTPNHFTGRKK